ncbi:hypothetical protein [Streptosporangium vulgare]|uniref:hypothetical protein n=1 Tax=Streptosporangium vulgare TaxID=46190 RepID=UPI0031D8C3B8
MFVTCDLFSPSILPSARLMPSLDAVQWRSPAGSPVPRWASPRPASPVHGTVAVVALFALVLPTRQSTGALLP